MPSVLEAPELIEYVETHELTTHDLHIERPQPRRAHPGFWRTLAHGITTYLTPMPYERQAPLYSAHRPFETPMDRLVREHPSLAILALAIV